MLQGILVAEPVVCRETLIDIGVVRTPLPGANPMVTVTGEEDSGWSTTVVMNWKTAKKKKFYRLLNILLFYYSQYIRTYFWQSAKSIVFHYK